MGCASQSWKGYGTRLTRPISDAKPKASLREKAAGSHHISLRRQHGGRFLSSAHTLHSRRREVELRRTAAGWEGRRGAGQHKRPRRRWPPRNAVRRRPATMARTCVQQRGRRSSSACPDSLVQEGTTLANVGTNAWSRRSPVTPTHDPENGVGGYMKSQDISLDRTWLTGDKERGVLDGLETQLLSARKSFAALPLLPQKTANYLLRTEYLGSSACPSTE